MKSKLFRTKNELEDYALGEGLCYWEEEFEREEFEPCGVGVRCIVREVVSPANPRQTIKAIIAKRDIKFIDAIKELTLTSKWHTFKNTFADRLFKALAEGKKLTKKEIIKYNNYVDAYNKYGCAEYINYNDRQDEMIRKILNNYQDTL